MTYEETIAYLFASAPLFQNVGADAYKDGLENTMLLDAHFGHPHRKFKTVHVAGTNGKGSCCHAIATALQGKGLKVGLYTSPHLLDFRERIQVDSRMIERDYVVRWVDDLRRWYLDRTGKDLAGVFSFFELTTALAFCYFEDMGVDWAVIEVGLGGRLDCTNIITPELSVITNISLDHTQFLGNTLEAIATEKAGIIKRGVPVVVGETTAETCPVFRRKADEVGAPLYLAEEVSESEPVYSIDLKGSYQQRNVRTISTALNVLCKYHPELLPLPMSLVCGLRGRWQTIQERPLVVCDTGHNVGGWQYLSQQISHQRCKTLRIVFGCVNDKDITSIMMLLPKEAQYYFTKASVRRARNEEEILAMARDNGLSGRVFPTVEEAYQTALSDADKDDFIFVGGSTFIVADLLKYVNDQQTETETI